MSSTLTMGPSFEDMDEELNEDDISEWIRSDQLDSFKAAVAQLKKKERLPSKEIIYYSRHIISRFKTKLHQARASEQQAWLDILLSNDLRLGRDSLDTLILPSPSEPKAMKKAAIAHELFSAAIRKYPYLLKECNTTFRRNLIQEAAVRGSLEIICLCRDEIVRSDPGNGLAVVSDMVLAKDKDEKTALYLAIDTGNSEIVKTLLAACPVDDDTISANLLNSIGKMRSLDIVRMLLSGGGGQYVRVETDQMASLEYQSRIPPPQYRKHCVKPEALEAAIAHSCKDILEFLVSIRPDILRIPACTLLHNAVENDLADIAKLLLDNCPELAIKTRPGDVNESNGSLQSVLDLVDQDTVNGKLIKATILPVLMRLLPISELRRHLRSGEWNEIYLDLTYLKNESAYLHDFLTSIEHDRFTIRFESALKYVDIPLLHKNTAGERRGAANVLGWLREFKNVENIHELHVEDSLQNPHSEEEIELALQGFDLRELDWRRTDLSILALKNSVPNLDSLILYSSGNLAALDHWLGVNGVSTLKKLRYLLIVIVIDNISPVWVERCRGLVRDEFDQRSNYYEDQIPDSVRDQPDSVIWSVKEELWETTRAVPRSTTERKAISTSAPISVAGLENFLQQYTTFWDEEVSTHPARKAKVKVAILDTGINQGLFSGHEHNVYGASFYHRNPGPKERESPWWLSTDPHGSYVANIISQLDPRCDIYVAQIAVHKDHISLSSVVKALKWAIEQGVQIINCSFVLFKKQPELEAQINTAAIKGIIIMCSTADEGFIRQEVWPAMYCNSNFANVFPIAACDFKGKLTGYSSETLAKYRLQGEQIDASHGDASLTDSVTQGIVSGSSVATAMASGIASLILSCEGLVQVYETNRVSRNASQVVANTFSKMCLPVNRDNGPMFITPSSVFPPAKDYFADNNHFKRWIIGFGTRLGSSSV